MNQSGDFGKAFRKAAPYINASYTMIGSLILFGLLGWWLDSKWDTKPVMFLILLLLGLVAGFYQFYKVIINLDKKDK